MVRQGIEQLERAQSVHLSYLVAGSGGGGADGYADDIY